jgi:hypothetical protein
MEQEKLYKLIIFLIGLIIIISYIAIVNWLKLKKSYKRKIELETKFEEIEKNPFENIDLVLISISSWKKLTEEENNWLNNKLSLLIMKA